MSCFDASIAAYTSSFASNQVKRVVTDGASKNKQAVTNIEEIVLCDDTASSSSEIKKSEPRADKGPGPFSSPSELVEIQQPVRTKW
ncbi:MAG: hypothetical protein LBF84_02660 [Holosporales bacterium]|nr:hypothetical protein [Holosporales bacterium]